MYDKQHISFIKRTEFGALLVCLMLTGILYVGNATVRAQSMSQPMQRDTLSGAIAAPILSAVAGGCGTGKIDLSWSSVSGVLSYRLYRDSSTVKVYENLQTMYTDSGLDDGTSHTYYLIAYGTTAPYASIIATAPPKCVTDSHLMSATSSTSLESIPSVPSNFAAVLNTAAGGIVLTWHNASSNESVIKIFRRIANGTFALFQTLSGLSSTFTDNALNLGSPMDYQVEACNMAGCSGASAIVSVPIIMSTAVENQTSVISQQPATIPVPPMENSAATAGVAHNETHMEVIQPHDIDDTEPEPRTIGNTHPSGSTSDRPTHGAVPPNVTSPKSAENHHAAGFRPLEGGERSARTAFASSEIVASMQDISRTVETSQRAIAETRQSIVDSIDAHITAIGEDSANVSHTMAMNSLRESLMHDVDRSLAELSHGTPEDFTKLKATINNGLKRIDTLAATTTNATNNEIVASIDSLSNAFQSAIDILKTSGGDTVFKDSNHDGISDFDSEHIYHIDPIAPSPVSLLGTTTLTAGEKVLLGYDPTQKLLVQVTPEEPLESLAPQTSVYAVTDVKLSAEKKIAMSGKALPNSYITLFVYSTPIIVTVRTDSSGDWHYTVDKELEDGRHTMYVATVDNTGTIVAKSIAIPFTKTAEAATLDTASPLGVTTAEKPTLFNNGAAIPLLALLCAFIIAVLYMVGRGIVIKNNTPTLP